MLADELIGKFRSECQVKDETCLPVESAILYAERFQHKSKGFYRFHQIPPKTEQAIMLMVTHVAKSNADDCIWSKVDSLLRFNI